MIRLLYIFSIAICSFAFVQSDAFKTNFKQVFLQSIKGLESLKGATVEGGNASTVAFSDFDKAIISKSESIGTLGVVMTKKVESEEKGGELLAAYESQIAALLPVGDYVRSQSYQAEYVGYMKTIYDFNSPKMADKQKRPIVEMGVTNKDGIIELVIAVYEPFFKNQYTPKMP
ncbi:MAG: hypothetical protein ACKVOK_07010 [Flavobacteriales bacterium]